MKNPRIKKDELELSKALRFISVAQQENGVTYQLHSRFINGYVIGFNGVLAAGHPTTESIVGEYNCPHTLLLLDALQHVSGPYQFVALDNHMLAVTTNSYRGLIPCVSSGAMDYIYADEARYPLNDDWKLAALEAGTLCSDNAQTVMQASVMTLDRSVVGTDGVGFIERMHTGLTPSGLVLPMVFVKAAAKVIHKIVAFGYSQGSFTLHYDNGAWLRTQLYQEAYPNITPAFALIDSSLPVKVPDGLFDAVQAVLKFSEDSIIYIDNNVVRTHNNDLKGARHTCEGLPFTTSVKHRTLLSLRPYIEQMDFTTHKNVVTFKGENARGMITKV